MWTSTIRFSPLSSLLYPPPCLSPCVRPNHSYLPDLRVVFCSASLSCLAISVPLLYLYACTRSYCRFYSHVCSLHNRPASFPCTPFLVSPSVSLSLACPSFPSELFVLSPVNLMPLFNSIRLRVPAFSWQDYRESPHPQKFDSYGGRMPTTTPTYPRELRPTMPTLGCPE